MYSQSSSSRSSAANTSTCQIVKIFILQAKLDAAAISQLYTLIDSNKNTIPANGPHFQLCNNPSEADVIISNIHMRKRLERHIDWSLAKKKAIVTPDWLHDSVAQRQMLPWRDYTALDELQEETVKSTCIRSPKQESVLGASGVEIPSTDPQVFSNHTARYACQRASPLVCPNQKLVVELGVLRMHRDFEGKAANALSYDRAISILKAYPRVITRRSLDEVDKLPHLGPKICSKIKEFVDTGRIEECDVIRSDEEFKSLKAFTSIHGVGTSTARHLYSMGLRTLKDMDRYYDVPLTDDGSPLLEGEDLSIYTPNGIRIPKSNKIPELNIKAALTLRQELAEPIPREEIEKMHTIVMSELEGLHPGCSSTIVGGYRRGKHQSNDADIVITHPNLSGGGDKIKNLRKNLIERLYKLGLITHVALGAGFHSKESPSWHSLENALTVFLLPSSGDRRLHRRLDLIFAAPEAYWSAVVGWTGSKMFERDLRLWAKTEKGLKFDSSAIIRRHDSERLFPQSEQDVFSLMGLEWIHPMLRNADV